MQSVAEKLYSVVCVLRKDYCLGLCLDRSLHFSLRATSSLAPWHLVALDTKKFDFWLFLQLHKTCNWWQALPFSAILFIFNKCLLLTYTGIGFRIYFSLDGWRISDCEALKAEHFPIHLCIWCQRLNVYKKHFPLRLLWLLYYET